MKTIYAKALSINIALKGGETQVGVLLDELTALLRAKTANELFTDQLSAVEALSLLGRHGLRIADHLARTAPGAAETTRWSIISNELQKKVRGDVLV